MPYDLSRLRVDIVDDNTFSRQILRSLLVAVGVPDKRIKEVHDAESALADMGKFTPDIVLCGLTLPGMDGVSFIRAIRELEDEAACCVPIIVCTAHTDERRVIACRDAGANEVLNKPVSVTMLYQRLVSVIENPRSFVYAPVFKGPDRRRRVVPAAKPRRANDADC
jgi:two-component system, chemotaxis family, chemotaxis protein CheY